MVRPVRSRFLDKQGEAASYEGKRKKKKIAWMDPFNAQPQVPDAARARRSSQRRPPGPILITRSRLNYLKGYCCYSYPRMLVSDNMANGVLQTTLRASQEVCHEYRVPHTHTHTRAPIHAHPCHPISFARYSVVWKKK
ncbi:hypothetical protein LX36DRAFT_653029 [Colletotrichum falcatum]|nr:hypothetical protein LX36DRAFT_653029 [Colletotrichum falcatum]